MRHPRGAGLVAAIGLAVRLLVPGTAEAAATAAEAQATLEHAATFFRDRLGVEGTYVWRYSVDGAVRKGEGGKVPRSVGWVEPPGTPAIGAAFLRVHQITGDEAWLDAAGVVAAALVRTQLLSGGWFYKIETDRAKAGDWCYRPPGGGPKGKCPKIEANPHRNRTVLDDNTTQSVLDFLMWFDQASRHGSPEVRDAIEFGLARLMKAQYSNGAFPVFFTDKIPGQDVPSADRATIPGDWSTEWIKPNTPPYFITNDNLPRDVGRLFLGAHRLYGDARYLRTAERIGDFLLAAQLPAPQPGWAQQYDRSLTPVWGRKFEPPAVVSRETAGCVDYLIELYGATGRTSYLDAAKTAAAWLESVRAPDGTWARYYELNTNRPLFVDNENRVTFNDGDLLDHYAMQGTFDIPQVLARLGAVEAGQPIVQPRLWISEADQLAPAELGDQAEGFVGSLDAEGRWTDGGWIDGRRFTRGVFVLARFIENAGEEAPEPKR